MSEPELNSDFIDFLGCLIVNDVRFLVVGAHALAVHGIPRATGDLDVWIEPAPANAAKAWTALAEFGAPAAALGFTIDDLTTPDVVLQIGLPPRRIDLLTAITGVEFADAWGARRMVEVGGKPIPFLSRHDLVMNKRATGRAKDLADLEAIRDLDDSRP